MPFVNGLRSQKVSLSKTQKVTKLKFSKQDRTNNDKMGMVLRDENSPARQCFEVLSEVDAQVCESRNRFGDLKAFHRSP